MYLTWSTITMREMLISIKILHHTLKVVVWSSIMPQLSQEPHDHIMQPTWFLAPKFVRAAWITFLSRLCIVQSTFVFQFNVSRFLVHMRNHLYISFWIGQLKAITKINHFVILVYKNLTILSNLGFTQIDIALFY